MTKVLFATFIIGFFGMILPATAQPVKPITDVKDVVGKWEGTITGPNGTSPYVLTIKADGTYVADGFNQRLGGTNSMVDGQLRFKSDRTGRTGTYTLREGDGKRVLEFKNDEGTIRGELVPSK